MERLRYWVRNVFGFSRSEANGFLILLPLMLLILFSYPIFRFFSSGQPMAMDKENKMLDSLVANWEFNPVDEPVNEEISRFSFDPNVASLSEFKALGVSEFLAGRIINYRNAGGSFKKPQDLMRIYGMDSTLFNDLVPYISIAQPPKQDKVDRTITKKNEQKENEITLFDLNVADTLQLKSIRGIGTVLATRIVKYRDLLGGFVEPEQLHEVFGLDSVVVKKVIVQTYITPNFVPAVLNLNTVSEKELSSHPYFKSKLAKIIVAYRFQHGSFKEIDDLLKLDLIDNEKFRKIKPYLTIAP